MDGDVASPAAVSLAAAADDDDDGGAVFSDVSNEGDLFRLV